MVELKLGYLCIVYLCRRLQHESDICVITSRSSSRCRLIAESLISHSDSDKTSLNACWIVVRILLRNPPHVITTPLSSLESDVQSCVPRP